MAKTIHNQSNFTAGELTPRMKGRGDVARYQNGAALIENGIVAVHGGVIRRFGTRFLAEAKYSGTKDSRLIRYIYTETQSFMLEFGDLYVRVFDGATGAVVLNSGLTPLEIVSPYTEAQLAELVTKQQSEIMYIFHKDVPTHELRRLSATLWTLLPVRWITQPFAELGHTPEAGLTLSSGAVGTGRTFTTSAVAVPGAPTAVSAIPFNASARVSFTPPASNGGAAIDSYTVTSSPGGFTATSSGSPIMVTGLTNGVAYTFTVTAHNIAGNSAASSASSAVTPLESLGGGTITASATPSPLAATVPAGAQTTAGPTATGGGTAPHTYAWSKVSGSSAISVTNTTAAQPTINSTGTGVINYATLRCVVTDANGNLGTVDVNVSIQHGNSGGGGGGGGGGGEEWPPGAELP
jgi:Fibronectin type III domain